jgi:thiol-disulfide isomerase/thioredoxin
MALGQARCRPATQVLASSAMAVWMATFLAGCSGGSAPPSAAGPPTIANDGTLAPAPKPVAPPPMAASLPKTDADMKPVAATGSSDVKVKLVDADEFKKVIAAQKGKVVLVDFWATYCGPCRDKFPQTLALGKKYASQGLTLVSVSMDSPSPRDQEKVLQFLRQQNARIINLANRLDDNETAFGAFDIDGAALPHYKVFARNGKVRFRFGGDLDHPFDEKDIERAIVTALKEK